MTMELQRAPASSGAPPVKGEGTSQLDNMHRNRLRQLRTEVQDLQGILESIRKGETSIETYADYIKQTVTDIQDLVKDLKNIEILEDHSDAIRHLRNILEQMSCNPLLVSPTTTLNTEQQLQHLNMLEIQCRKLVFQVGILTIPARVNSWLRNARPGYYIPFHLVFEDELPIADDRAKVVNYLTWQPIVVEGGLVDPATGLIYKYSQSHAWKVITFLLLVASVEWIAIGFVQGPAYLTQMGIPISPPQQPFLVLWLMILAGVIFHIAVTTTKRMRSQPDRPPIIALGTLLPLINAKIGQILFKVLLTLIGFFGLVFGVGENNLTLLNAFLVGYSLDSVVDLFGASVEQLATTQAAAIKRQLGDGA